MKFEIPVQPDCIRTLKDPIHPEVRTVHALVKIADVPGDIPMDPDPRVPKADSKMMGVIKNSLLTNDGRFHLLNRGITLSVKSYDYSQENRLLSLDIPSADVYGIIDGGHTYKAIVESARKEKENPRFVELFDAQYVHLEIILEIEGLLADIAEARNYSIQLKSSTLENYKGNFEWFLSALGDNYAQHLRVREGEDQPVSIMDAIQVMCAVNPNLYPIDSSASEAYKNAAKCLANFVESSDKFKFKSMRGICRDILRLNDFIRYHWKNAYNRASEDGQQKRFGARAETKARKRNRTAMATYYFLDASDEPIQGDVPIEKGLSLPVLSAFRALIVTKDSGLLDWAVDPFIFFDKYGPELIAKVMKASESKNSDPHNVGRDSEVYQNLYLAAYFHLAMEMKEGGGKSNE